MLLSSIFSMVCGWAGQARAARDRPLAQSFGLEPQYLPDTTHRHSLGWHRLSPAAGRGAYTDQPEIERSPPRGWPTSLGIHTPIGKFFQARTQLPLDRLECYGVNVVLIFIRRGPPTSLHAAVIAACVARKAPQWGLSFVERPPENGPGVLGRANSPDFLWAMMVEWSFVMQDGQIPKRQLRDYLQWKSESHFGFESRPV